MNCLLVAINAKYIHTNLAVRYLKGYAQTILTEPQVDIIEYTINHPTEQILSAIYEKQCQLICFSCYIWNIETVLQLTREYKLLAPDCKILLGGPEVSFCPQDLLEEHPEIDYVLCGEGEASFAKLLDTLASHQPLAQVPGLCYRQGENILVNPQGPYLNMDLLPFPYPDLENYQHQIVYYEASRGCPYRCQYCLSSTERQLRKKSPDRVKDELSLFLAHKVKQVKFVDRTFNADRNFAREIWQFLMERDNGVTNFHFEISADLLDDSCIALLSQARPGLFQMEIGVQSTNEQTLTAIERGSKTAAIFNRVRQLRSFNNIHLHLDLIAGLPYEGLDSFAQSFDAVFSLSPHQLQLGFLKLLKGSGLRQNAQKYGLIFRPSAPYEVLFTPWLPYSDTLRLKAAEWAVETYLNSGRFDFTVRYLLGKASSPFGFFLQLGEYSRRHGVVFTPMQKELQFTLLRDFALEAYGEDPYLATLCRLDIACHERPRKYPQWAQFSAYSLPRQRILEFLEDEDFVRRYLPAYQQVVPKQRERLLYGEIFPSDPMDSNTPPALYLFDYQQRNIHGHAQIIQVDKLQ